MDTVHIMITADRVKVGKTVLARTIAQCCKDIGIDFELKDEPTTIAYTSSRIQNGLHAIKGKTKVVIETEDFIKPVHKPQPILLHINQKVRELERKKGFVTKVQHDLEYFEFDEAVYMEEVPPGYMVIPKSQSVLLHINQKVKELERKTKGVVVLQFAEHPQGMAMIARVYLPSMDKEYSFPDVIYLNEVEKNEQEIKRIDVLFDEIHKALTSIQVVQPSDARKGGIIQ